MTQLAYHIDCKLDPYFGHEKKNQECILAISSYELLELLLIFCAYLIFHSVDVLWYIQPSVHWIVSNLLLLYCNE